MKRQLYTSLQEFFFSLLAKKNNPKRPVEDDAITTEQAPPAKRQKQHTIGSQEWHKQQKQQKQLVHTYLYYGRIIYSYQLFVFEY
jgi:hypothetical protein